MAAPVQRDMRKVEFIKLLTAIRARRATYSFRCVQAMLKSAGMPSASGWAPLIAKFNELNYADPKTDWDFYHQTILSMHNASIHAGTTAIWMFKAPKADIAQMLPHLIGTLDKNSLFATQFPYPITEEELARQSFSTTPVATAVIEKGRTAIVSCGKRAYREREQLEPETIDEAFKAHLGTFQELIVVRSGFTQAYDRLVIDTLSDRLEIHIDLCCPLNTEELQQMQEADVKRIKEPMEKALRRKLPWLNNPINFYPCIANLYKAKDGAIQLLGHVTSTKSVKIERMRNQHLDLREELFHKKGRAAVNGTDAFSIKKGWPTARGNVPSVLIPGHSGLAGAIGAAVRHAVVENCATTEDFDTVISHLT